MEILRVAVAGIRRAVGSVLLLLAAAAHAQDPVDAVSWPRVVSLTIVTATDQPAPGARVKLWMDELAAGASRYSPPAGGRPITSAFVEPDPFPVSQPPALTVEADAAGCLRLELPSERAVFEVSVGEGAASGLWYARALQHEDAVTVRIDPVGEIAGIVVGVEGEPIAGARVRFQDGLQYSYWDDERSGRGEPRRPADAVSGEDGRFVVAAEFLFFGTMSALTPGGWTEVVSVHSSGRSPPPVKLREPGRFRIRGTCVDAAGQPLAHERVTAQRGIQHRIPEATSDAAGRFEIALVDAGWYSVSARNSERFDQVLDEVLRVQVTEAAPIADVTLRFIPSASIRGQLRWADGRPVARATISIPWPFDGISVDRARHFFDVGAASTADDGSFELLGLRPGRSFDLAATLSGDLDPGMGRGVLADRLVHGVAAGTSDLQIVFTETDAQGGQILLNVQDAGSGEPLQDAEAWVKPCLGHEFPSEGIRPPRTTRAESGETIVLDGLRHTTPYAVLIRSPGHELTAVGPIEVGDEPVKLSIALRSVATTRVTVVDDAGAPIARAFAWVLDPPTAPMHKSALLRRRHVPTDDSGSAETDVPVGLASFIQATVDGSTSDVVRVLPATVADSVVQLVVGAQRPGSLDVRVIDESGHPLPAIEVSLSRMLSIDGSVTSLTDATGTAHFPALQPGLWVARCADADRGYGDEAVPVFAGQPATLVLPTR